MRWFHQWASSRLFVEKTKSWFPFLWTATVLLFGVGLVGGLWIAPADYQQGNAFRIMYVHVPAAMLSMGIYVGMTIAAAIYFIWHIKLADVAATVMAPVGASIALIALVTGAIWGKPMWGTYWIWDARLTSELILLFIYIGIISLRNALPDESKAAKATAILIFIGFIDLPIIHYSVYWWSTLHQKSTLLKLAKPSIAPSMLWPLLVMIAAFSVYVATLVLRKMHQEIMKREQKAAWVQELLHG